jgi:hypothetical protein
VTAVRESGETPRTNRGLTEVGGRAMQVEECEPDRLLEFIIVLDDDIAIRPAGRPACPVLDE